MKDGVKQVSLFPSGVIEMPPSKSIAHRAAICSALAGQLDSRYLNEDGVCMDVAATIRCVRAIMAAGQGGGTHVLLDCGESGSTLRFLIPVAKYVAALLPLSRKLCPKALPALRVSE